MDSVWFEVTVLILAFFLAVFLILSIFLLFKILEIVNRVKKITDRAEKVADKAEHVASFFEKSATPVAIMKIISNTTEMFAKKHKKKRR